VTLDPWVLIPWHARRAFADEHGIYFDLTPGEEHGRPRANAATSRAPAEAPNPDERRPARRAPRGYVSALVLGALAVLCRRASPAT
jgi:hypothetical protein